MTGLADGTGADPPAQLPCSADELRTLFLFEKLTDEQLAPGCAAKGTSSTRSRGRYTPKVIRRPVSTCCLRAPWCCPAGSVPTTSR
jgi:hypothetical protein